MPDVATTPQSNVSEEPKKGEAIVPEQGAITPEGAEGEPTTPENKILELEGQVVGLKKELENAQTLQAQADRKQKIAELEKEKLDTILKKIRSGEISPDEEIPEGETSIEQETRLKARVAIQQLIIDNPKYQEVVDKDITLKQVLKKNPFALIGEYLDAEDAADQMKDILDERVTSLAAQPEGEPKKDEGKKFNVGPIQPGETPPAPPKKPEGQAPLNIEESIKNRIKVT